MPKGEEVMRPKRRDTVKLDTGMSKQIREALRKMQQQKGEGA